MGTGDHDDLVARLDALARLAVVLEAPDADFGRWQPQRIGSDGTLPLPAFEAGPALDAFRDAVAMGGWVVMGFDWPTWASTDEARALRRDAAALATATPDQLARLLTALVRAERFSEGTLDEAFEAGLLLRIARRAAALADGLRMGTANGAPGADRLARNGPPERESPPRATAPAPDIQRHAANVRAGVHERSTAPPERPTRAGRPQVVVNMAMSADGKVDTAARHSGEHPPDADLRRVDELRAAADAILVGGRTLLAEDPRLTVRAADLVAARRAAGRPAQPARVGVASDLAGDGPGADAAGAGLRADGRFVAGEPARVILFTSERTPSRTREALARAGAEVVVLGERRVDLRAALAHLAARGVERLLVEGGGTIVEALLRDGLVDEIELYVAPLVIGGRDAPTPAEGPGFDIEDAVRLELVASDPQGDGGVVLRYRVAPGDEERRRAGAPHEET